jgi:sodium-coupled neutral amino acid transporter 11
MSQQPLQTDHLEYGSIPQVVDLDLLQSTQPGYGTRSISETSLNIVNATIGSGILGLPFALYLSGFTIGISISIFVSILTYLAIYSLILSGQRTRIFDFAEMAQFSMGKFGFYMLNLMLFIQSAGSTISYFICKHLRNVFFFTS